MKFEALQFFVIVLFGCSFFLTHKRDQANGWIGLFLMLSVLNVFTHAMSQITVLSLSFIIFPILGYYILHSYMSLKTVKILKNVIIYTCLFNGLIFLCQYFKHDVIFTIGEHGRPTGLMCYPIGFSLLCAISLLFALESISWLSLPIGVLLAMSNESSVFLGLVMAFVLPYLKGYWKIILLVVIGAVIYKEWHTISGKLDIRFKFLEPVFKNVWSRPLDGWGLGSYRSLGSDFFGFDRGNWSEMHCEPLDLFFSMGFIGVAWAIVFINKLKKYFTWNKYTKSFLVIAITSCFHSVFHFMDTLWIVIVIFVMYEIELREELV